MTTPALMSFEELTINQFHAGLRAGAMTSRDLTEWYLARIAAHNKQGAAINAVVTVNPAATADAEALDQAYADSGEFTGPLHGVPVLVKDQAETAGLRTTFGSKLFEKYVPQTDATLVRRLREAGAIILAKTTMCDFAAGWFSSSSLTGHTRNVYDSSRDSGGSSAGSGAGVSANFGLVAVGEDTGGSIRIPASFNNVYGLRVTTGLISRAGFSPLVHFQDTPGPMARTVADLALLLDSLVGYDPADPFTVVAATSGGVGGYSEALQPTAMGTDVHSWRVGVLETGFGDDGDLQCAPVNAVVREAIERIGELGVGVVPGLEIEGLATWIADTSVYLRQSKSDITRFLSARDAPVSSFAELHASGVYHPLNDLIDGIATGPDSTTNDLEYQRLRLNQEEFRRLVLGLFADSGVDFLVYPSVQVAAPTHAELAAGVYTALAFPTNTVIGSQAGLPALSIPVGFTPDGRAVGLELLGTPFSERAMLYFTAAFEAAVAVRKEPDLD